MTDTITIEVTIRRREATCDVAVKRTRNASIHLMLESTIETATSARSALTAFTPFCMQTLEQTLELYDLVSDPEIRRAAAKTLKGFCLTYLAHHFPLDPSDFFDDMCAALESNNIKRLEVIGFRGCAKSTVASLALVLWAALEHPDKYPFIIMLADTRSQASINAATVQHELRNNDLILKDYGVHA